MIPDSSICPGLPKDFLKTPDPTLADIYQYYNSIVADLATVFIKGCEFNKVSPVKNPTFEHFYSSNMDAAEFEERLFGKFGRRIKHVEKYNKDLNLDKQVALINKKENQNKLIEERAKALFFRDMVDGIVSQDWYNIWEIDENPVQEEKMRNRYLNRARKELDEEF